MRKIIWLGLIILLAIPIWYVWATVSFAQEEGFVSDEGPPIIKPEMLLIEESSFLRGINDTDKTAKMNECPQYSVTLSSFYIDKYEVTNAVYKKFVEATGHRIPRHWIDGEISMGQENHPVVYVSWSDAVAYAQWAGKRLPTEAEWERAARGTEGLYYPWGNEFDPLKCRNALSNIRDTAAVNEYKPGVSPAGCHHMAGNASEWVQDRYDWRYYKRAPRPDDNPTGPSDDELLYSCPEHGMQVKPGICPKEGCDNELEEIKKFPNRVVRGGSWVEKPEDVRCARRIGQAEDYTSFKIGFRCAKDAE